MSKGFLVIVDDEHDLLDLFEYNFVRQGFEVEVFDRVKPALDFVQHNRPDMILCDWMLPGMTGLEFCKTLKEDMVLADIPFVMVTCRNEQEAITRARAEGVTDYITKPIRMSDLIERIKMILNRKPKV
jgi:DNA-binding response OmpR family regulator